jgi:hypothetical protein
MIETIEPINPRADADAHALSVMLDKPVCGSTSTWRGNFTAHGGCSNDMQIPRPQSAGPIPSRNPSTLAMTELTLLWTRRQSKQLSVKPQETQ